MKKLKFRQINEKTRLLIPVKNRFRGVSSWCRYIRSGLGMTLEQLAHRAGVSISHVAQIERNETQGKITLSSLKKVARAMDCELVYGFVPKKTLLQLRKDQAHTKALEIIKQSQLQMELEDQAVSKTKLKQQLKELELKLLEAKSLWD